jgi:uncharacterized protein (TIGR03086 family)
MSEIAQRYARLSDAFAAKLAAVPQERWSSPSPCPEWTARDLARHVVETQGMFLGFVGRQAGDLPSVDEDPLGAWNAVRAGVQAELEDPERAATTFEGLGGTTKFEDAVDRFLNVDLVVHGWDLARATGLDDGIAPDDLAHVRRQAESFGDGMRSPGAFGPALEPPPGADEQTQLLASWAVAPDR